jgi:hypothetical protein
MPLIARVMLGLTTAFCSLVFLMISRVPNVGSASFMKIMGLLCGVATILLFFPYDRFLSKSQLKKKRKRKRSAQEVSQASDSIYNMDLTQISLPGCLLFIATVGVIAVLAVFAGSFMAGNDFDRRTIRKIGFIGFLIIAGFFLGGKFLLNQMGMDIIRQPKKKSRKGKGTGKRRRRRPPIE